ncbi:hypothetical protein NDU88_001874 [Pleurodeles waltl]|uniref:Uncharacterized protein n=1 Tax=Pleurodeles waltl TaxID=8319 RepID=A0AAV7T0P8_PLEWA|nr:hypothetical protein NDU88_001874 [Pleurodeles waltl]
MRTIHFTKTPRGAMTATGKPGITIEQKRLLQALLAACSVEPNLLNTAQGAKRRCRRIDSLSGRTMERRYCES